MAVQCYCVRFAQSDHQFLHESHVFSNISRILSKSEEENDDSSIDSSLVSVCVCVCVRESVCVSVCVCCFVLVSTWCPLICVSFFLLLFFLFFMGVVGTYICVWVSICYVLLSSFLAWS